MSSVPPCPDPVWIIDETTASSQLPSPQQVGFKAYNLMRMARVRLPVPPALVLGVGLCADVLAGQAVDLPGLLRTHLRALEMASGLSFGSTRRPLLVSVRSGAAVSMPGMLETILNVGLCDATLRGLIRATGNPRLAWDCYRRLVQCFAEVVHGAPAQPFEALLARCIETEGALGARDLDAMALAGLTAEFLALHTRLVGEPFPQDPFRQLELACEAVFRSWNSQKAKDFRRINRIEGLAGTAVTIQSMVYGNAGGTSGSGVGFTRDPATGENRLYMDFLFNSQGEDVVAGRSVVSGGGDLARVLPGVATEIERVRRTLENEFGDMQDFEFTVHSGTLALLQTRSGKRAPWAALKIAVDLVAEGLIEPAEALRRLDGLDLDAVVRHRLALDADASPVAQAISASMGVVCGRIALSTGKAEELAANGDDVILVRRDVATEDIAGFAAAKGILTAAGGRTSHAAVVARQMNKVCLVGCRTLSVDADGIRLGDRRLAEGDYISLDGDGGLVYAGRVRVVEERPEDELRQIAAWRRG